MSAAIFLFISVPLVSLIPLYLAYKAEGGFKKYSKCTLFVLALWTSFTYILGQTGFLQDFSLRPPRFFMLMPFMLICLLLLMRTNYARLLAEKTSIYTLIGMQSFRFLPEFFLDLSYQEGLAPIQMTYHGRNFDILVAITALFIFLLNKRIPLAPRKIGIAFSLLGMGLLINIIAIAILSTPTPIRYFMNEPANTFVAEAPYVWLPSVMVGLALWGHFLLIKKLMRKF